MFTLILLFMIGIYLSVPTAYWIIFALACIFKVSKFIIDFIKVVS